MKIAVFTDFFYPELGGIQDSAALLAQTLGKRGHTVEIYAPSTSEKEYRVTGAPAGELDLGKNVRVRRTFSFPFPSPTMQSRIVPPTFLRWRTLKEFNPDIIHTHTFFGLGIEALFSSRRLGVPVVGTNHFAVTEYPMYVPVLDPATFIRLGVKAVTWYYNHCDFVTTPSQWLSDDMTRWGLRVPRRVISNPVDTSVFCPAQPAERVELKEKLGFTGPTMIYAGKFSPEKYVDVLVRTLPVICREIPDVTLALAGHGSERPRLEKIARELGVEKKMRFLGTLTKPDLVQAFQAADVFVSGSTSENQSMVLLQAMNCGLPAVGADSKSFRECIPIDTGFLAQPHAPRDFAEKLVPILTDTALRSKMGEAAIRFGRESSTENVANKWEEVYVSRGGVSKS